MLESSRSDRIPFKNHVSKMWYLIKMVNLKVNRFHCDNLGMENIDPYQSGITGGHESILVGSFEGGAFGKHV